MKGTRTFLAGLSATALLFLAFPFAASADVNNFTVTDFSGDYTLSNADKQGELHIVERIQVAFTDYNHGILRALPQSYKKQSLKLHVNSVSSDTGAPNSYTTYEQSGNTVLKIGDPNRTVTGSQEYTIDYTMQNIVTFYNDHDELYWDINGDQWQQPFTKVTATLHLPVGLHLSTQGTACYTGSFGSTSQDCSTTTLNDGTIKFETAHPLTASQTLTTVVGLQKGYFQSPTAAERAWPYVKAAIGIGLLPLVVGGFGLGLWLKRGRDAKGRGVLVPEYAAPEGISPLAAGTLLDFKLDNRDITATIIDLARRGYIKIIETKDDRLILKDKLTYVLQLTNNDYTALNGYEKQIMGALFSSTTLNESVDINKSKNKLYKTSTDIRKQVEQDLTTEGYFLSNPLKAGKVLSGIAVGLFVLLYLLGSHLGVYLGVGAVIALPIAWLFARAMPARTAKGTLAKEQLLGLKMYMDVAEKDRLEKLQGPDAAYASNAGEPVKTVELFEKLLPYAMVLGVEKQWAKQFEGLYTQPPSWYSGNWAAFNAGYLVGNLSDGFGNAVNTAFSAPSSSGSSGFGGGGFSGGGGGGGGGGGW